MELIILGVSSAIIGLTVWLTTKDQEVNISTEDHTISSDRFNYIKYSSEVVIPPNEVDLYLTQKDVIKESLCHKLIRNMQSDNRIKFTEEDLLTSKRIRAEIKILEKKK